MKKLCCSKLEAQQALISPVHTLQALLGRFFGNCVICYIAAPDSSLLCYDGSVCEWKDHELIKYRYPPIIYNLVG